MAAAGGLPARRDRCRRHSGGAGTARRPRPACFRAADREVPLCRAGVDAARLHALGLFDHSSVSERAGERDSASHRRTASDRSERARELGVDADRNRKSDSHSVRSVVWQLRWPGRPDSAGGCVDHVRARPRLAAPPARLDSGRRRRRRRCSLQYAVGRDRLRHRGDEPRLRDPHVQPHHCRRDRGWPDLTGAGGQLRLFRQQCDVAGAWHGLAGRSTLRRSRRLRGRAVQPHRHRDGAGDQESDRTRDQGASTLVCIRVRPCGCALRPRIRRHDLRHRL